ncbi:hypothetical protein AAIR98_000138 [Elusimicrobium simillimum]|uniref:hypothetical protein n=1 Tax=Elusimicrobium simillimum TaxID=3143438 RepID=UPI003C6FF5E7
MEEKAQELFNKNLDFVFVADATPAITKAEVKKTEAKPVFKPTFKVNAEAAPLTTAAPEAGTKTYFQSSAPAPQPKEDGQKIIYKEEPFVKADFSAEFDAPAASLNREVPAYVKNILNIIPGEVIS